MELCTFDIPLYEKFLRTKEIGRKLIYKDVTETTMDDAEKSALSGSPHGTAVLAEKQVKARGTENGMHKIQETSIFLLSATEFLYYRNKTKDKGRKKNAQVARQGKILLLANPIMYHGAFIGGNLKKKFIFCLQEDDIYMVEVAGSLAVLLALQDLGMKDLKMKWLNDIWVRGHKIAGVLAEDKGKLSDTQNDDPRKTLYILGIGVNINADTRRNPEIGMISTSAKCELKGSVTCREQFLAAICGYLEELLPLDTEALQKRVMPHQLFCAKDHVKVHSDVDGKVTDGMIVGIHEDWGVTVKDKLGKAWKVSHGFNSLRPCVTCTVYVYGGRLSPSWSSTSLLKSLTSLLDITHTAVVSLNDAKMKEGKWQQEAIFLAIGEISLSAEFSEEVHQVLSMTLDYIKNGGQAIVTGNTAAMMSLYLHISKDVKQQLESKAFSYLETTLTNVDAQAVDQSVKLIGYSLGQPIILPVTGIGISQNVLGYYNNENQTNDKAAIIVTKYGKGNLILISFNIEVSYGDDVGIKDKDLSNFTENVFQRDAVFQDLLSKFNL